MERVVWSLAFLLSICLWCSYSKSSSLKFSLWIYCLRKYCNVVSHEAKTWVRSNDIKNTWLTKASSSTIWWGGFLNTWRVSYIVGHRFVSDERPKQPFSSTRPTLKTTFTPSQRNMSQTRSMLSHGNVRVYTHRNHSVMYKIGSIFCFFCLIKWIELIGSITFTYGSHQNQ